MKWVLAFLFLPFVCAAQSVKLNQYDKFLKQHRVELEPVSLLSSSSTRLAVVFSAVGSNLFVQASGWGWGAATVDAGDDLVFRLANDSVITATSVGLQTFEPGVERSTYRHRYRISHAALQALAQQEVTGLRKFSFGEASEVSVPRDQRPALKRSAGLFLSELARSSRQSLTPIAVRDVFRHIGDSVRFCSKVYRVHKALSGNQSFTLLDLQADYSEPIVTVMIGAGDLAQFGADPAALFLNRDACVSGVVALRNNVPTVVVRNKNQLLPADGTGATGESDGATQQAHKSLPTTPNNR